MRRVGGNTVVVLVILLIAAFSVACASGGMTLVVAGPSEQPVPEFFLAEIPEGLPKGYFISDRFPSERAEVVRALVWHVAPYLEDKIGSPSIPVTIVPGRGSLSETVVFEDKILVRLASFGYYEVAHELGHAILPLIGAPHGFQEALAVWIGANYAFDHDLDLGKVGRAHTTCPSPRENQPALAGNSFSLGYKNRYSYSRAYCSLQGVTWERLRKLKELEGEGDVLDLVQEVMPEMDSVIGREYIFQKPDPVGTWEILIWQEPDKPEVGIVGFEQTDGEQPKPLGGELVYFVLSNGEREVVAEQKLYLMSRGHQALSIKALNAFRGIKIKACFVGQPSSCSIEIELK